MLVAGSLAFVFCIYARIKVTRIHKPGSSEMDATAPPSPPPADIEDTAAAGKCLCGATSYRITKLDERSPGQILVCHCRDRHYFPKFKPRLLEQSGSEKSLNCVDVIFGSLLGLVEQL